MSRGMHDARCRGGSAARHIVHDPDFVDYFRSAAYPAVFSSALRSPDVAGLAATLEVVRTAEHRRTRPREISTAVRKALADLATPPDRSLIRFSLHTALSDHHTERIMLACTEIRERFGTTPPCVHDTPDCRRHS
ncbi:7-keto-8-aminopelargonate synthetase-like enzyme [Nocardia sp. GAS34]|uniref:hypothetical protein n=1 Tax=unclassified Nocardia TaxID=2637762 RepID=UPI003D1EFCE8